MNAPHDMTCTIYRVKNFRDARRLENGNGGTWTEIPGRCLREINNHVYR